ncbi:aspartyl protease family protein [Prosthecobacter sp. SYSU 5D2]|uniref:aspartyl protease family protein n=1 Tax=Prosthecobacter sp. SYSU 5D2 TaxID=3134134 RepID=UPI0031FF33BA
MKIGWKRWAVLGAVAALGCLAAGRHFATGRPQVIVPLTIERDHVYVQSSLGPVLLDTGAEIAVVDAEYAQKLGLPRTGQTVYLRDFYGEKQVCEVARVPAFSMTGHEGKLWQVPEQEAMVLPGMKQRLRADFILGLTFFKGRIVELDFLAKEMRLLRNLPFGWNCRRLPLRPGDGLSSLEVTVADAGAFQAVLDTGMNGFFHLSAADWERLSRQAEEEVAVDEESGSALGPAPARKKARAAAVLTVGNMSLENAPVLTNAGAVQSTVGLSVLKNTCMALDWDAQKAVFTAPSFIFNHITLKVGEQGPWPER